MKELKAHLANNPEMIREVLEHYDFSNVRINRTEIRCSFGSGHDASAIRIRLNDNDGLFVQDFVRSDYKGDLISYIMAARNVSFIDVVNTIRSITGITSYSVQKKKTFGGFFDNIKRKSEYKSKTLSSDLVDKYRAYNIKFLKDNISFMAQKTFGIGFDDESQRIIIPIRNAYGELIGLKGRCNYDPDESESKYIYLYPCAMSTTLYGYSENYQHLMCADEIYIFEAEKSVMQAYDFGVRNCVALGSNSLSTSQIRLLYFLQPKRIIFMLDKGLDYKYTYTNRDSFLKFCKMNDTEIYMWNWKESDLPDKSSPTDYGEDKFFECLMNCERI